MKNEIKTKLSHVDSVGKAQMVDIGNKITQRRIACAQGKIILNHETIALIKENQIKKGDVLAIAQFAGIQAAKLTAQLIPLCHPLLLDNIALELKIVGDGIIAESRIACIGKTGVEMEALTAVNIALLTVYDMCKAVDKNMKITDVFLLNKEKSDVI